MHSNTWELTCQLVTYVGGILVKICYIRSRSRCVRWLIQYWWYHYSINRLFVRTYRSTIYCIVPCDGGGDGDAHEIFIRTMLKYNPWHEIRSIILQYGGDLNYHDAQYLARTCEMFHLVTNITPVREWHLYQAVSFGDVETVKKVTEMLPMPIERRPLEPVDGCEWSTRNFDVPFNALSNGNLLEIWW